MNSKLKTFKKKVTNIKRLPEYTLFVGILLISGGYVLNGHLTGILATNIGIGSLESSELSVNSNDDALTDNVSLLTSSWNAGCKFINTRHTYVSKDDGYLTLVNQIFGLKDVINYDDLVYLRDYGIDSYITTRLRKEPAVHLSEMLTAASKEGIKTYVSSGYRMISDQVENVQMWATKVGSANAYKYAALPKHSEHHLGTTVDILTYENNERLLPTYEYTKLYKWLKDNSYKYGFVESYPEGSTSVTGYTYEPWHYRYVGIELATELHQQNELLQDYLYKLNGYCLTD